MLINLLTRFFPKRSVIYDSNFFGESWFANWQELSSVLDCLISEVSHWKTVLDFGCGPGIMIDRMNEKGIHYVGCDYSFEARDLYLKHFGKYPSQYVSKLQDLETKNFDVFLSFDVFEHMTDQEIATVIQETNPIPYFFLNISRDLRTPGHINVKSDKGWIRFFNKHGLSLDKKLTDRLRQRYCQARPGSPDRWDRNIFVFKRDT